MNGGRRRDGPHGGPGRGKARGGGRSGDEPRGLHPEEVRKILDGDAATIVDSARRIAAATEAKASQIRNVYAALVQIRQSKAGPRKKLSQLVLMKPRLAYAEAREQKAAPVTQALTALIDGASRPAQGPPEADHVLEHIFDFGEALVAYHKTFRR